MFSFSFSNNIVNLNMIFHILKKPSSIGVVWAAVFPHLVPLSTAQHGTYGVMHCHLTPASCPVQQGTLLDSW